MLSRAPRFYVDTIPAPGHQFHHLFAMPMRRRDDDVSERHRKKFSETVNSPRFAAEVAMLLPGPDR